MGAWFSQYNQAGDDEVSSIRRRNREALDNPDMYGRTPLHCAAGEGNFLLVKILLEGGCDPNGYEHCQFTPLYIATLNGHLGIVQILLHYDADLVFLPPRTLLQSRNSRWATRDDSRLYIPLNIAAATRNIDCFKCLLINGAETDLSLCDDLKLSPQVIASHSLAHIIIGYSCPLEFGKLFIAFGGNVRQRDVDGKLAIDHRLRNSPCRKLFYDALYNHPMSLQGLCRIVIRRNVTCEERNRWKKLALPPVLINYILFKDLIPDADEHYVF